MTTDSLRARDAAYLIHPLHNTQAQATARIWVKGEGAVLTDSDGAEYIDGVAGLWNVLAGHGRRELAEAARVQAETLAYASGFAGSSNPLAIELAERLATLTYPSINRFFFTSGGGEATDSSIKMSRAYWTLRGRPEKSKVISRVEAYHGATLAAMSATLGCSSSTQMRDVSCCCSAATWAPRRTRASGGPTRSSGNRVFRCECATSRRSARK